MTAQEHISRILSRNQGQAMTTITIERAVLLRALEALRPATAPNGAKRDAAFEELRDELAAPATAPEPVAWMSPKRFYRTRAMALTNGEQLIEPLYLHPPATAPAQPEIVDLLAEMYELILANKVVLAEKSGGVWTWPDRAIEAVRKHRSGPAQPERKPMTDEQIEKAREATFSTGNPYCPVDSKSMRKAARAVEAFHGIKETP